MANGNGHPGVVRYLVLWLTTACNLRCAYCYRPDEPPAVMGREVISAALELAASSGRSFHVQLAGGEPTLEPELLEYAARTVRERGYAATLAVQTNATLLDKTLVALFSKYSASVGVSLDGPPEIQESLRGGAGATFRGLDLLARARVDFRATAVLSQANVGHLGELALCLAAYPNARGLGLDLLVRKGRGAELPSETITADSLNRAVLGLVELFDRVNARRHAPLVWREYQAVAKALRGCSPAASFCHAGLGQSLAVHPSGRLYPCSQSVGDASLAAGKLDAVDWDTLRNAYRGVRLNGHCGGCPLEGRCPGECPSRLKVNASEADRTVCHLYRALARNILEQEAKCIA
jgi:uncharacterized protein